MIQYLLLVIACQVLFLALYDLFLKKETFFNVNRAYLLLTPLLSLVLPFIKISNFGGIIPRALILPKFDVAQTNIEVIQLSEVVISGQQTQDFWSQVSPLQIIAVVGMLFSLLFFFFKLGKIFELKNHGKIQWKKYFYEVTIPKSNIAFSFFNNMFLGEEVKQKNHDHIIAHELVHIQQKHSWDLLYFEVFRIVFWFNPLVYMYQKRITELHEFIADRKTSQQNKKEHYQQLLQEVFQTENISFTNQFFNQSLIKKRIKMLQKSNSKKRELFKYILIIPMLAGIMVYTSACNQEETTEVVTSENLTDAELMHKIALENNISEEAEAKLQVFIKSEKMVTYINTSEMEKEEMYRFLVSTYLEFQEQGDLPTVETRTVSDYTTKDASVNVDVPFTIVEKRPAFKGFENQSAAVFKEQLDKHVRTTFQYPADAQADGVQGRVYINFRINTDGSVSVIGSRGPDKRLEAEAERIINALPAFVPGEQRGEVVPVTFAYPIVFKLS
ncbi:TonB family C-terminal domain-containing protein [Pustulibacterium marinum]|uniref:TonB family C-terminal domain-containing protein n=1 Tax=Pustulibacterium marinum TaxID=1224947 RepID=A0A1I7I5T9_9FLAO|nr:M56 family metallopeptidase [Pustulibacterium marinum]SFU68271.1 TonB family C-terminal domain-containing protein [Pustulibacterium marinum]